MNKVFLSGNLTRDPEVKYTPAGKAMAKMGIAVSRRSKNAETGQYDVDFFNLTAWEKTAEFCGRYLRKGSRVFVEGNMRTYSYTGQDGSKRSGIDIWIDNIEFGSSKREGDAPATTTDNNTNTRPAPPSNDGFDDDFVGDEISDDSVPF
ncbi:MAG: single-stranded DNA-binding protein [Selenomonadaceae bacterium]|nr:single-stranded DNA-binding protein [Selenomonadaceae bacterium]